jgi:hypothetical protein
MYKGDFALSSIVRFKFTTIDLTGLPVTLSGTPAVSVYTGGSTTESTAGVTLSVDYDSRTGLNDVAIDTSADGTFYSAGADFEVVITTGTVDGVSVVGYVVGSFSLNARSALRPTTAGRTLDVSAGGEAGIDWANVGSPTTTVGLSGTTIKDVTDVETKLGTPAGASIAADIADVPTANENADALLGRNIAGGSSTGRTVSTALYFLRNKWTVVAGVLTVYQVDDTTPSWTGAVTTDAGANPITANDPS